MSTRQQHRNQDLIYWRRRLAHIEQLLVAVHLGQVDRRRRSALIAAWHGVNGLVGELAGK